MILDNDFRNAAFELTCRFLNNRIAVSNNRLNFSAVTLIYPSSGNLASDYKVVYSRASLICELSASFDSLLFAPSPCS